jgi:hypothetical protein
VGSSRLRVGVHSSIQRRAVRVDASTHSVICSIEKNFGAAFGPSVLIWLVTDLSIASSKHSLSYIVGEQLTFPTDLRCVLPRQKMRAR